MGKNTKYGMTIAGVFLCCFCILMLPRHTFAHKVNIFAYVEGETVYTESYFPDGKRVCGGTIEVFDSEGTKLLEGKTDNQGMFAFQIPKRDELTIVISASLGHRNTFVLAADEIPEQMETDNTHALREGEHDTELDMVLLRRVIGDVLDEKLQPVCQRLARLEQETISLTEILGGIGYIVGIAGIVFYLLGKKRNE